MLGLVTFLYVCLHFAVYLGVDQFFDFAAIGKDIVKRKFITVGFVAFLLLIPLAVTSTDGMVQSPRVRALEAPAPADLRRCRAGGRALHLAREVRPASAADLRRRPGIVAHDPRDPGAGAQVAISRVIAAPGCANRRPAQSPFPCSASRRTYNSRADMETSTPVEVGREGDLRGRHADCKAGSRVRDPGLIRTGDLRFRKPPLYPPELRGPAVPPACSMKTPRSRIVGVRALLAAEVGSIDSGRRT